MVIVPAVGNCFYFNLKIYRMDKVLVKNNTSFKEAITSTVEIWEHLYKLKDEKISTQFRNELKKDLKDYLEWAVFTALKNNEDNDSLCRNKTSLFFWSNFSDAFYNTIVKHNIFPPYFISNISSDFKVTFSIYPKDKSYQLTYLNDGKIKDLRL